MPFGFLQKYKKNHDIQSLKPLTMFIFDFSHMVRLLRTEPDTYVS